MGYLRFPGIPNSDVGMRLRAAVLSFIVQVPLMRKYDAPAQPELPANRHMLPANTETSGADVGGHPNPGKAERHDARSRRLIDRDYMRPQEGLGLFAV